MKEIELARLTLTNWRGEKQRTTLFGRETLIRGGNGLGKSRHFDAFCWLLFGKDSNDRKDFELRTYDENHRVLHKCECSVEADLILGGESHTLKREFKEQWVKPRGQVEEVFKGSVTECTWDGVPVKVGEFQKRVNEEIINDTVFKMITNPLYFLSQMKWQLKRETLMQLAGAMTDEQIAEGNEDFKALLDTLSGKSLSDYRKELAMQKNRLKDELEQIAPRIDQTQKMMPEAEDWQQISNDLEAKRNEVEMIDEQLQSEANAREAKQNGINKQIADIRQSIFDRKQKQLDIERKAKLAADRANDAANEERRKIQSELSRKHGELSDATIERKRNLGSIENLKGAISLVEKRLEDLRKQWFELRDAKYDEQSDICPCCGQRLPEEKITEAHRKFTEKTQQDLAANNATGKVAAAAKKSYEEEVRRRTEQEVQLSNKVRQLEDEIRKLNEQLADHPASNIPQMAVTQIPEWQAEQNELDALDQRLNELSNRRTGEMSGDEAINTERLKQQKTTLQLAIADLQERMAKKSQIDKSTAEIDSLQKRGKALAQQIADIERREYTAAQFSKKKIEDCEQRINAMFTIVKFQLFDHTQDGNEFECCIPLVNGVPYQVANTASQLNAGLDVINTLCKSYEVTAPIFIDGAESVNEYIETFSQMIFLEVTTDTELSVSIET